MRRLVMALAGSVGTLLLGATTAYATPITWTLQNVVFDDGGIATGSFTYDADIDTLTSVAITTTAGSVRGGNAYGVGTPNASDTLFDAVDTFPVQLGITPRLIFSLATPMTNAGGTVAIGTPFRLELTCAGAGCTVPSQQRLIVTGSITTNAPEPTAMLLFGTAAAGLLARRRRAS
jgi:hypothetical protein